MANKRKNPPAKWVLPTIVNPPKRRCYIVQVPDEIQHIGAFYGALFNLTSARFWQDDLDHTALQVAAVWRDIFDDLKQQDCNPIICPIPIAESEYDMSLCEQLRFDPTTGKLQAMCCGAWTDIAGQPLGGLNGPGQPGASPVPGAGGQCQTYHGVMNGKDQWQCPAIVSAGDTVQFSNMQGAWADGHGLWYCLNGQVFFAGGCTVPALDPLDPVPLAGHMALLSKIAGVFTDVSGGTLLTVPGGVSNALLLVQANDYDLTDNGGQITFDVTVCNNQAAAWSHTFDFTISPHGFVAGAGATSGHYGDWTPGVGWVASDGVDGTETIRAVDCKLAGITPFNLTAASFTFNLIKGVSNPGFCQEIDAYVAGVSTTIVTVPILAAVNGDGQVVRGFVQVAAVDRLDGLLLVSDFNPGGGPLTGSGAIISLTIEGTGPEPVWS